MRAGPRDAIAAEYFRLQGIQVMDVRPLYRYGCMHASTRRRMVSAWSRCGTAVHWAHFDFSSLVSLRVSCPLGAHRRVDAHPAGRPGATPWNFRGTLAPITRIRVCYLKLNKKGLCRPPFYGLALTKQFCAIRVRQATAFISVPIQTVRCG